MNPLLGSAAFAGGTASHGLAEALAPLDLPRQALVNLLFGSTGIAKPEGAEEGSDLSRILPALAGGIAGVGSAFVPGLQPFALPIGAAVAGLAQGGANAMNPTNRGASSPELLKALGGDPDGEAGGVASFGLGMATDPLSYLGGMGAARGAGAVKGAAEGLGARAAEQAALAGRVGKLQEYSKLADVGVARAGQPVKEVLPGLASDLQRGPQMEYRPEVLQQTPGSLQEMAQFGKAGPKTYKRVESGLAGDLERMGLASPTEGGLRLDTMTAPPSFAQSRGGWLMPTEERKAMLAGIEPEPREGILPMPTPPHLQGPPSGAGPLTDPVGEYRSLRSSAGMDTPLGQAPRPTPSLAKMLGEDEADRLFRMMPEERLRAFPSSPISIKDPTTMLQGHVLQLPVDQAQSHIRDMLADAMAQQQSLQSQPYSRLEQLLRRVGY